MVIVTMTSYEFFLKHKGFVASIEQNINLWSWYRGGLNKKNDLVLIGASRSRVDVNIPFLKKELSNYRITQLCINGQYPIATLKSLANDENFVGTVVMSANAETLEDRYLDMQKPHNDYYHDDATLYKSLDAYLLAYLQSSFRFLHPLLGLEQVVKFYDQHYRFIGVFYTSANLDQSMSADYSKTKKQKLLKHIVAEKEKNYSNTLPTPVVNWVKNVELLQDYIHKIEQRGGNVVLVRFPTDKGHWQLDEKYYPREKYWDKITGVTKLHFHDIDGLNQIDLPDSSHLDTKDSKKFTEILFGYLINLQVLDKNLKL
jgi:hypothetical protein